MAWHGMSWHGTHTQSQAEASAGGGNAEETYEQAARQRGGGRVGRAKSTRGVSGEMPRARGSAPAPPGCAQGAQGLHSAARVRTLLPGRARPRAPRRGARGWGGARARPHAPSTVPRPARGPASAQAAPPPRRASARGAACAPLELGAHWLTQPGALPTHAPPPALARARTHARTHAPAVRESTDIMASTGTLRVRGCAGARVPREADKRSVLSFHPTCQPVVCGRAWAIP